MLRERELEHERIQSEIRRNDAEAKKMVAEAKHFDRSIIRNVMKFIMTVLVTAGLLGHFCLDTFKILHELRSYENKALNKQKKELKDKGLKIGRQYLEVLIQDASFNAYNAYMSLFIRKNYLKGRYASPDRAQYEYAQAHQSLHDYWKLVQEIAKETQHELFSEVKQKISDKLKENEEKNRLPIRRKVLDLIERHVNQVRADNSQFPDDLIDTFMEKLESQESSNGENKN
ncbi:MAG: hypothetical protein D3913_14825 [Candidatus Electrothrix sp. LOE1_4_5]|nr:hypothetical protein [Candidatus Electrothrix gigas]